MDCRMDRPLVVCSPFHSTLPSQSITPMNPQLKTFLGEFAKGTALCVAMILLWILCALI